MTWAAISYLSTRLKFQIEFDCSVEEHLKHSQRLDSIDERILRNVSCYNFHCGRRLQYYVCPSARLWARLWGIWEEAKNEEAGAQFPLRGAVTQWKLSNLGLVWNANQFDIHLFQTWRWLGTVFNRPETDLDILAWWVHLTILNVNQPNAKVTTDKNIGWFWKTWGVQFPVCAQLVGDTAVLACCLGTCSLLHLLARVIRRMSKSRRNVKIHETSFRGR